MNSRLYDAHIEATSFYRHELAARPRGWAAEHLRNRRLGVVLAADSEWSVGYAPDRWSGLVNHLRHAGFDDQEIVAGGLAFVTKNGLLVDRFRDRIMFVANDQERRPVGFIGRAAGTRVRYLNTRNTEIYAKARTLVGLDAQVERLRAGALPVFVEGTMDAPAVRFAGDDWAGLACCGTSITREHAAIARRYAITSTAVVALDGDRAGQLGAVRSLPALMDVFDEVLFADLPDRQDPAALHTAGRGALPETLGSARPLIDYAIEVELRKWENVLDHLSGQVNAVRAVAPLLVSLPASRVAGAVARLAKAVDLDTQVVSNEVLAALEGRGKGKPRSRPRGHEQTSEIGVDEPDRSRTP